MHHAALAGGVDALKASQMCIRDSGDTAHPILLDGNFDEDWGDSLALTPVLHHAPRARHTVTITALPSAADVYKRQALYPSR